MVTESSNQQLNEHLPQLPEFNDTQWLDSTIQAMSNDNIVSSPLLLYVISYYRTYITDFSNLAQGSYALPMLLFHIFNGPLGDQLSQNVMDQSLPNFQDRYTYGWV